MSKGKFNTPRPVGTVEEIRVAAIKVQVASTLEFQIDANLIEGADSGGNFIVHEKDSLSVLESDLSASDQTILNRFLKLIIRNYVSKKGYTDVTVT